mmetsp:Transcript_29829/g.40457  ORF Transcript_29829/g.40457 Transcript_29829/m.40457 type:complete len:212 (-) Transcript_29829:29-664(-)
MTSPPSHSETLCLTSCAASAGEPVYPSPLAACLCLQGTMTRSLPRYHAFPSCRWRLECAALCLLGWSHWWTRFVVCSPLLWASTAPWVSASDWWLSGSAISSRAPAAPRPSTPKRRPSCCRWRRRRSSAPPEICPHFCRAPAGRAYAQPEQRRLRNRPYRQHPPAAVRPRGGCNSGWWRVRRSSLLLFDSSGPSQRVVTGGRRLVTPLEAR